MTTLIRPLYMSRKVLLPADTSQMVTFRYNHLVMITQFQEGKYRAQTANIVSDRSGDLDFGVAVVRRGPEPYIR